MKPIETFYQGFRFRSRLEARWAVFFDAMGYLWRYEYEGYVLDDQSRYLPDFWLPECKTFIEVKPIEFSAQELKKCEQLAKYHPVILAAGLPEPYVYSMLQYMNNLLKKVDVLLFYDDGFGLNINLWVFNDLVDACEKAKQARFEHGESG